MAGQIFGVTKHQSVTINGKELGSYISNIGFDEVVYSVVENILTSTVVSQVTPTYTINLTYVDPVGISSYDFASVRDATLVIIWDGGQKDAFSGVTIISIGESGVSGTESKKRTIKFSAEKS